MKRQILVGFLFLLALLSLVGIDTFRQYRARPFFAGGFGLYGRFSIIPRANWERRYGIGLDDNLHALYDYRERVLLVVRVQPDHKLEWLVDDQLLANTLRIRRQDDDLEKIIEWRRDCMI